MTELAHGDTAARRARLGLVLALAVFAWHVAHTDFLIDDAFISFRYAANWADGRGLAFNPGEAPVEGYSNFLWVALLSLSRLLGFELETASRVLSISAATVLVALVQRSLLRRRFPVYASTLGTLALVTFPPFATWATGGLETSLFALIFFVAFEALSTPGPAPTRRRPAWPLLVAGAALPLVRTDGMAFVLVLALTTLLAGSSDDRRRLRPFLSAALVSFAAYLAWRRSHYGLLVANTVHVKADLSPELLLRGLKTTCSYAVVLVSPVLVLSGLFPGRPDSDDARVRRSFCLAAALSFGAFLAYNTLIGGDWMPMFRMLAPASPLLAIVIAGLVHRLGKQRGSLCAALAIGAALLPSFDLCVAPISLREGLAFRGFKTGYQSERQRWQRGIDNLANFTLIGKGLAQVARPDESFTAGAIGAIGYYSDLRILDRNGLVEPSVAALPSDAHGKSAGHDKRVPRAFFLDHSPTYFEAMIAARTIEGPESPAFATAARQIGRFVFSDPGDRPLTEHCLPEAHALRAEGGIPAETSLILLRATDDADRARALWKSLGF